MITDPRIPIQKKYFHKASGYENQPRLSTLRQDPYAHDSRKKTILTNLFLSKATFYRTQDNNLPSYLSLNLVRKVFVDDYY
jgi:hypothetical protein